MATARDHTLRITKTVDWSEVTDTTVSSSVDIGYVMNNSSQVVLTLPSNPEVGQIIFVIGKGSGGWKIAQNAGQTIHFGDQNTTAGTGGSLESTDRYDAIKVVCMTVNSDFVTKNAIGNLTVT
jgi:hypothetical protein